MVSNEFLFKSLCDHAPVAMIAITDRNEILYANNSFCNLLGYNNEELKTIQYSSLLKINSDDYFHDAVKVEVNNAKDGAIACSYLKKNGETIKLSCKSSRNFDENEESNFQIIQVFENIDISKEGEIMKFKSGIYESILDSFPDLIYIKNRNSQFININRAIVERFKESSSEKIIGKTDFDYYAIEHAQQAFDDEQRIIKTGNAILNFEERETWPDGSITYLSTSKMPLRNKKGDIIGTYGVSRDITDKKLHEQEIVEKTRILNAITSKMPVVIYKYRKNRGLLSLSGDPETIKAFDGSKVAKLKVADSLSHLVGKLGTQKDKYGYFNFSSTSVVADRDWHFENFIFEGNIGEEEFLGLALDITDRKHTEQKLKRDAKDLEKINKELNQFAYIISHDLKAPLRAITNLSEWIQEDLSDNENQEVRENLKLLRGRVGRMENLINGILVYSRLSRAAITFEHVDSGKVIDDVLDYLMVPKNFKIRKAVSFPVIFFSKVHLEQVFSNLISNAIKHHDKEVGEITIGFKDRPEYHEFKIEDNGPGINPEFHEKVFKIFQTLQARDSFESTGIGLTIVKKIIEEQGGTINIDSEEGKGAKFIFTIPKSIKNNIEYN